MPLADDLITVPGPYNLAAPMPFDVGSRLGPYEIVAVLGSGGMGDVYRAVDTRLHRAVAIKVLPHDRFRSTDSEERFLREARATSALNHQNIVTVYDIARERPRPAHAASADVGAEPEVSILVMEYVPGPVLTRVIPRTGLSLPDLLEYAIQMASALAAAHAMGIVHRDIKPANVIITPGRQAKILDFGLAKLPEVAAAADDTTRMVDLDLTEPGRVMGTIAYMSPEQARGEAVDARTDLFSLGAVMYEMATGRRPFPTPLDWTRPSPPTSEPGIDRIILKLLEPDRGLRYQSAADLLADLRRLGAPTVADGARRRRMWAVALVVAVALFGSIEYARSRLRRPVAEARLSDGNRASQNRQANEYYEKALLFGGGGIEDNDQQLRMLERALAIDPKFAAARAEYAFGHVATIMTGDSNDPAMFYRTEEQVRQALRDDPDCGRAHSVLALTYLLQGRRELVLPEVDAALRINPDDLTALTWRLEYNRMGGDARSAVDIANRLLQRWPLYWPGHLYLANLMREQGNLAGARREAEAVLEQDPYNASGLSTLAVVHLDSLDFGQARQTIERVRPKARGNYRVRLVRALLLAREGTRHEAEDELNEQTRSYATVVPDAAIQVAEIHAVMGDTMSALQWLDRAARGGDNRDAWFSRDPHLVSIRSHPDFQKIVASIEFRRQQSSSAAPNRSTRP